MAKYIVIIIIMNILSLRRQNSNDLIWMVTDQVVCCRGWLKKFMYICDFFFKSQHKKVLTKIRKKNV